LEKAPALAPALLGWWERFRADEVRQGYHRWPRNRRAHEQGVRGGFGQAQRIQHRLSWGQAEWARETLALRIIETVSSAGSATSSAFAMTRCCIWRRRSLRRAPL